MDRVGNLIALKLDLFCRGLRLDEGLPFAIRKSIVPNSSYVGQGTKRASLSEGKCFLLHNNGTSSLANLAVMEPFVRSSPYAFTVIDGDGWIVRAERPVIRATPTGTPAWYMEPDVVSVFQAHGTDVLATALSNVCSYKRNGLGCKFCALDAGGKAVVKTAMQIRHALTRIMTEGELSAHEDLKGNGARLTFREININSGSLPEARMFRLYLSAIEAAKETAGLPISAQICPIDKARMRDLRAAGLDTISFNMEVFDAQTRADTMPEKAKRHPVPIYLRAIEEAADVFGPNQVSSWLIAGLEPATSTIAGCEAICARGGIPHVAVFRPLVGSDLAHLSPPTNWEVAAVYATLKEQLHRYGLDPLQQQAGCVRCGGCSALKEIVTS